MNIDQLENKTNDIKDKLGDLKNAINLSKEEITQKARELLEDAKKVEINIQELKDNIGNTSQKEIERVNSLLRNIAEIKVLSNEIEGQNATNGTQQSTPDTVQEGNDNTRIDANNQGNSQTQNINSSIIGKTKAWVGDQRESVWDGGKWSLSKDGLENLIRAVGFAVTGIGAGAIVYKGVKSLWKWAFSSDEKEQEGGKFWDRWYVKALKWGSIGAGIYWLVHGIFTGNWSKDFFDRGTQKTERAKDQVNKYKELSPEVREKYEKIGDNVNNFYDKIRENETNHGYKSSYDLGTISENVARDAGVSDSEVYKGLVPSCMDDGLNNIEDLLSEKNFTTYLFENDITKAMATINSLFSTAAGEALGSFVGKLDSFKPFNSGSGTLSENIEEWLKSDPENHIDELNLFFRQYSKVLTYMKDKERAIAYKIVEEKCLSDLENKTEREKVYYIQNKLNNKDYFEGNVKNDSRYQSFMNSKILNCGEALTNSGLFDGEMSPILKEGIIDPLNDEFDNIMQVDVNGETIIDKGIKEVNEPPLGEGTKDSLIDMCTDLEDDMSDNNGGGLFRGFSYIFNSGDSNREIFLEESGLKDFMNALNSKIENIKEKIRKKTVTKDELQQLKDTALAYFAFQKEMQLATYTFQSIKSDNPDVLRRGWEGNVVGFNNFTERLMNIFKGDGSFSDYLIVTLAGFQITFVLSGKARRGAVGAAINVTKRTAKKPIEAITWVAGRPSLSNAGFRKALQGLSVRAHKESYFLHYALNGKIKDERFLLDIAKNDLGLTETNSMGEVLYELLSKGSANSRLEKSDCELLWKYAGNTNIKKLVKTENDVGKLGDALLDGFRPISKVFKVDKTILGKLKEVDALFEENHIKNADKAKTLLEDLLSKSVHSENDLECLKKIFKNENDVDKAFFECLTEMDETPKAIRGMAKHLNEVKTSSAFSTVTREIKRVSAPNKISALKKLGGSLLSMPPKDFIAISEFIELLDSNSGFIGNMTIINKILNDGIETESGIIKKIEIEDLINNPDGVIHNLNKATQKWRDGVGAGKINKFKEVLGGLKRNRKIFKNADGITALTKLVKLLGKIT